MSFNVDEALAQLRRLGADASQSDEKMRLKIRDAVRQLLHTLETPLERAWYYGFENPVVFSAMQILIDLGLWEAWFKAGGGEKSVQDLKKMANTDVEENLLRRLLRLLASVKVIEETGVDTFKPTKFSLAMGEKDTLISSWIQCGPDHIFGAAQHLPEHLKKTGYREPLHSKEPSYLGAFPEKLDFFRRCQSKREYYESFNGIMISWTKNKIPWPEYYDTSRLVEGADLSDGKALVVDVGGNIGVDIASFLKKHPDIPAGSLVLQDLPELIAIAETTLDSKIKAIALDFFTHQPVQDSRAYFLHAVLHDWPDETAMKLLANVKAAMKPGYSKLLVCDIVIRPMGTTYLQATMDINMMTLLDSHERTEQAWSKLLTAAGFSIIKFWPDPRGYETVIETEVNVLPNSAA